MKAKVTLNCGKIVDMDEIKEIILTTEDGNEGVVVRQHEKKRGIYRLETKSLNMVLLRHKERKTSEL